MKRATQVKKDYRRANKALRALNKNITEDFLWRGRFVVRLIRRDTFKYSDNSGYWYRYFVRFIDKKDGVYKDAVFNQYQMERGHLFWEMNDFIVKYSSAWKDDNNPYKEEKIDYTKVPLPKLPNKYKFI